MLAESCPTMLEKASTRCRAYRREFVKLEIEMRLQQG